MFLWPLTQFPTDAGFWCHVPEHDLRAASKAAAEVFFGSYIKGNWVNLFLILIAANVLFCQVGNFDGKKWHLSLVQNSTNWQFPKTSQSLDKLNHPNCQVTQVVLHFLSCHEPRLGSCQCAAVLLNWKSADWTQLRALCIVLGNGGSQRHTYYVIYIYICIRMQYVYVQMYAVCICMFISCGCGGGWAGWVAVVVGGE